MKVEANTKIHGFLSLTIRVDIGRARQEEWRVEQQGVHQKCWCLTLQSSADSLKNSGLLRVKSTRRFWAKNKC